MVLTVLVVAFLGIIGRPADWPVCGLFASWLLLLDGWTHPTQGERRAPLMCVWQLALICFCMGLGTPR